MIRSPKEIHDQATTAVFDAFLKRLEEIGALFDRGEKTREQCQQLLAEARAASAAAVATAERERTKAYADLEVADAVLRERNLALSNIDEHALRELRDQLHEFVAANEAARASMPDEKLASPQIEDIAA